MTFYGATAYLAATRRNLLGSRPYSYLSQWGLHLKGDVRTAVPIFSSAAVCCGPSFCA